MEGACGCGTGEGEDMTTPERSLTDEEIDRIGGWVRTTMGDFPAQPDSRRVADAQLAKADAWWQKRETKLVYALKRISLLANHHLATSEHPLDAADACIDAIEDVGLEALAELEALP